jgi:PEP-CTERM motif
VSSKTTKAIAARLFSLVVLSIPFVLPARANLIINPIFDGTITSNPDAGSIEATIDTAVSLLESLYSNPITVSIYFQEGGGLGESDAVVYAIPYTQFYNALLTTNANPAAIAGLQANGGNAILNGGVNPAGGGANIEIKPANANALGIDLPPGCYVTPTGDGDSGGNVPNGCALSGSGAAVDGIVSLQTSITDPPNSPQSNYYDLVATAQHEIDEILGLGSALENCDPGDSGVTAACAGSGALDASDDTPFGVGAPEDLFRWSAAAGGTRTLSADCALTTSAYFAYGPDSGGIAEFNNSCNGGDFGDWQSNPLPNGVNPQVQDAFSSPGQTPSYGQSEIDALSAVGYTLDTPEPGTMILFGASMAGLAAFRRCKRSPTCRPVAPN